jgi:hypothetical protein
MPTIRGAECLVQLDRRGGRVSLIENEKDKEEADLHRPNVESEEEFTMTYNYITMLIYSFPEYFGMVSNCRIKPSCLVVLPGPAELPQKMASRVRMKYLTSPGRVSSARWGLAQMSRRGGVQWDMARAPRFCICQFFKDIDDSTSGLR